MLGHSSVPKRSSGPPSHSRWKRGRPPGGSGRQPGPRGSWPRAARAQLSYVAGTPKGTQSSEAFPKGFGAPDFQFPGSSAPRKEASVSCTGKDSGLEDFIRDDPNSTLFQ